jgi:hypothetical protein
LRWLRSRRLLLLFLVLAFLFQIFLVLGVPAALAGGFFLLALLPRFLSAFLGAPFFLPAMLIPGLVKAPAVIPVIFRPAAISPMIISELAFAFEVAFALAPVGVVTESAHEPRRSDPGERSRKLLTFFERRSRWRA